MSEGEVYDENGIEICCENCRHCEYCDDKFYPDVTGGGEGCSCFEPSVAAYEARIAELQNELNVVQESERAEAQEADRLRAEVKELKAHNEVLQKRVEEFSMELLDRIMHDNKDVLMRLKQAESEDNYENFDIERDYD